MKVFSKVEYILRKYTLQNKAGIIMENTILDTIEITIRDDAIHELQVITNLREYLMHAVCSGSTKDCAYVREMAIRNGIGARVLDVPRALCEANTHNHVDVAKFLTEWIGELGH